MRVALAIMKSSTFINKSCARHGERVITMERPNSQEKQFINVDREIMVEIVNLCHFNEPQKLMPLLKYILPDWVKNINGIYFQDIYLKNDPKCSMIYQELPGNLLVFMWEQEGIAYASCFLSTSDDYKPRDSISILISQT